jgi:tRNA(Ile2) C34 agmatinyltransferase TiaS
MGLLANLERLVNEHGSAVILKERLELLRDQAKALEKRVADLERDNRNLQQRLDQLQRQVTPKNFVEHRGVLLKRTSSGALEETVYCPTCRTAMNALDDELPFRCSRCKFLAPFRGQDLAKVLSEVHA